MHISTLKKKLNTNVFYTEQKKMFVEITNS